MEEFRKGAKLGSAAGSMVVGVGETGLESWIELKVIAVEGLIAKAEVMKSRLELEIRWRTLAAELVSVVEDNVDGSTRGAIVDETTNRFWLELVELAGTVIPLDAVLLSKVLLVLAVIE
jgi:hypothetical protein